MNTAEHQFVGALLHDRIIGALELCCRRGEMLMIQNKRVNWETCQIGIPAATTKDKENRRIPFNSKLEERRPTASPGGGKLIGLVSLPDCPRFVPGNLKI
jgi:hypothetical protein